ncbi:MAG TPA: histidine phosphatase family protein [Caulobacteraceae bacterium]|jgi:2,3-bisphosphoglycerate-dependent phosphoglycerate mutase|nr:histidine phosphatase family protein [Caulobacteraceae bacterium]
MASLILIRHCESSGQTPDAALTEAGARAAEALIDRLQELDPDAVYSSPYRRARTTVQPFADRAGLSVTLDERLHERVLSAEPLDDWLEHIRRSYEDIDHRPGEGGETLRETQARGLAALNEIVARGHRLPVVASHGNLISTVLRAANPRFGFDDWRGLRNPDLFELTFEAGRLDGYRRLD